MTIELFFIDLSYFYRRYVSQRYTFKYLYFITLSTIKTFNMTFRVFPSFFFLMVYQKLQPVKITKRIFVYRIPSYKSICNLFFYKKK